MKKILKKILPVSVTKFLKRFYPKWQIRKAFRYDRQRYLRYSDSLQGKTVVDLMGNIIKQYHVVEKGLTMPETRLGFGQELVYFLINDCITYIRKFGMDNEQLKHALSVVLEYETLHRNSHYDLLPETQRAIENLKPYSKEQAPCSQITISKADYFKHTNDAFPLFADSRHSVRNYTSEEIPLETIEAVLNLCRNTPSACNRQTWRTYVYTDKEQMNRILSIQGGNRGFGHLGNRLIVITSELGMFCYAYERNQAFIDGGMYAMNLLYALHYHQIAGCILNCSNTPEKDRQLQQLCKTKKSEVFIAMVICGIPPKEFKIASSPRYDLSKTNTVIN